MKYNDEFMENYLKRELFKRAFEDIYLYLNIQSLDCPLGSTSDKMDEINNLYDEVEKLKKRIRNVADYENT